MPFLYLCDDYRPQENTVSGRSFRVELLQALSLSTGKLSGQFGSSVSSSVKLVGLTIKRVYLLPQSYEIVLVVFPPILQKVLIFSLQNHPCKHSMI